MPRLLALVPYLLARPGIPIAEAAADFGVSAKQLRRDLELLWMCGLPGYGPGDLIDLSFSEESVTVTYDAGMRRPLRLTAAEATALLVALRALADTPGIADSDAVRRAVAKLESAVGSAVPSGVVVGRIAEGAGGYSGGDGEPELAELRATVRGALERGHALRLRYYTASRDAISDRTVDPMRLLLVEGRSYLEAWCRRAEGVRLFRLDRIDSVEELDEAAAPPPDAVPRDVSDGLFRPGAEQPAAELLLSQDARWVAEYYPVEEVRDLPDGRTRVLLRYGDTGWMERLVLGLGGDAVVVDPPELAERVTEVACAALRRAETVQQPHDAAEPLR
jgi:proteasome accessory factor C